ncbi:ABC taurine transporter, binding protein inner membrane component [Psychromonas ingrahamii 37]|uniref:ABC taurine transporter, binding protein inner membrane component n=1 Tax=Psychromonas ingrahamii (strain DSM 17664 / CCUG 51855 / 37) TaxID=357804 RepID=A1SR08_PSYIN|nr:ABC transporter permease subunit [Psychromonas ingrahamii]ABM01923.1 ABC taurine transporter, binding protein inner membrane component [Psychromonas ingrahamii 37]
MTNITKPFATSAAELGISKIKEINSKPVPEQKMVDTKEERATAAAAVSFLDKIELKIKKLTAPSAVPSGEYFGTPGVGDSRLISVCSTIFFIAIWAIATEGGFIKPIFLPSPFDVVERLIDITVDGFAGATLLEHLNASLVRIFGAFILACLIGIPLGITIGCNRVFRGIFDPLIEFYRPLPPLAYLPLIIIWLGIDESSKVTLIFLAMLAPIVLSARAGVTSVRIEQIQVAYSMGASPWQVVTQVIARGAMPDIMTGMRIAIGFGWTTLVAAEMVAAEQGIGFMVLNASEFLVTDVVIAGILVIGIIAYCFDLLMRYLEAKLIPWKGYN